MNRLRTDTRALRRLYPDLQRPPVARLFRYYRSQRPPLTRLFEKMVLYYLK